MAERLASNASDPSVSGGLVAWHEAGQAGILVRDGGAPERLAGSHPALGGARIATIGGGGAIDVRSTSQADPFELSVPAPGADAVAVSSSWLVWRAREDGRDAIRALPLGGGRQVEVARAAELGRPALQGGRIAFHVTSTRSGRIVIFDLATGQARTARQERRALLLNPSLHEDRLLYVRAVFSRQELLLGPVTRRSPQRDRRLWSTVPTGRRDAGHEPGDVHKKHGQPHKLWKRPRRGVSNTLWTTALAGDAAYVTRLRQIAGRPLAAEILRVPRQRAG
jgi:hypothetical protein